MLGAVAEGGQRHVAFLCGGDAGNFACLPFLICGVKSIGQWFGRPAKAYAFSFGSGNAFRLSRADIGAFVFGDEGEDLQHDIRNKLAHERVGFFAGIEQGHIEHKNIRADTFCNAPPLVDYHIIVPAQSVDGFNDEQVADAEPSDEAEIICAFEVLTAFLVEVNVFTFDAEIGERFELSCEILVLG